MVKKTIAVVAIVGVALFTLAGVAAADGHIVQLESQLLGSNEVMNPGDPDGSGFARVTLDDEALEVCFDISSEGIALPTAAHIHRGGATSNGPVLVNLDYPANGSSGCVPTDIVTIRMIENAPSLFYVNVHTAEFMPGAIRGQLAMSTSTSTATGSVGVSELAFTGADDALLGAVGAAMVGFGALAVALSRRYDR